MVFFLVLDGTIDQFIIHLRWLINRQYFYRIQNVIKQCNNNARQHKERGNEEFIFFKKGNHKVQVMVYKSTTQNRESGIYLSKNEACE